jgi:anti-sigma factor RsiW
MSLRLDGLLDQDEERSLLAHLEGCTDCSLLWAAMVQADALLVESVSVPVSLPADFTLRVMQRVSAAPVVAAIPAHASVLAGSVVPAVTSTPLESEDLPIHLPEYVHECQARVATYVRGMAALGISVAGVMGVMLALVVSGVLEVGGALEPAVQVMRTFFAAASTWARSLVTGLGSETMIGGGLLLGLLAFAAWQIITNYHGAALEQRGEPQGMEAMA